MTSSVDPTLEIAAITARLTALGAPFYEGIDPDEIISIDAFGKRLPYRDMQPGSVIPAAGQRLLAAGTQSQPHVWAFQIAHVAPTRKQARELSTATDLSLIGWNPSSNAGPIGTFYFTVYDQFAKNGERPQWVATRFYETTLGMSPDFIPSPGGVVGGYGDSGYGG